MPSPAIIPILDSILGSHKQFARGEHYYFCPFCHHHKPKLAVNTENGRWHCWKCNTAGRSILSLVRRLDVPGSVRRELATLLADEVPMAKRESTHDDILHLPAEFIPLASSTGFSQRRPRHYLHARNIRDVDIIRYNIGYCTDGLYANRIIIPSYDAYGRLNYFVGRDYTDSAFQKYKNPPVSKNVIAFDSTINWEYPIVLVEGFMDAIVTRMNAIPLIGSTLTSKLKTKIFQLRPTVYLALDADATNKALHIAETLLNEGLAVYYIPMPTADPASVGFQEMQRRIHTRQVMNFPKLMSLKLSTL